MIQSLGIFAELVARHIMENNKDVRYKAAPLIEKRPVVEADIVMQGIGELNYIDVKVLKVMEMPLESILKPITTLKRKLRTTCSYSH